MTLTAHYNFERISRPVFVKGTAGTTVSRGSACFYAVGDTETPGTIPGGATAMSTGRVVSTTAYARQFYVEQCSITNYENFAGLLEHDVTIGPDGTAAGEIIVGVDQAGATALTNQSVTAGDLLGAMPGSWNLFRGAVFTKPILRVTTTVDRSTTAGPVIGTLNPNVSPEEFAKYHFVYDNDFLSYVTTGEALTTIVNTTAGSNALNGVITASCAAMTDNSPGGTKTTQTLVQFQTGAACFFEAKFQLTEADTNAANWLIGFQDKAGTTTTTLQDNGAGPAASIDMAAIYKVDGSMFFRYGISRTTAQALTTTTTAFASATDYRLGILYNGMPITSGGGGRVFFFVNGVLIGTAGGAASGDELKIPNGLMYPTLLVKSGSATGTQTMLVDYMRFKQAKLAASI